MSAEDAQQYYEYYQSQDGGEIYADLMEDWIEVLPEAENSKISQILRLRKQVRR